ncbi:hypothetical protein K2Z84_05375 [Candidatus Binatia bacterium]|nr:hypothetical protein [Candidatus Binatia bacterium]
MAKAPVVTADIGQVILDALLARVATVTQANGFTADIGRAVFDAMTYEDPLVAPPPCTLYRITREQPDNEKQSFIRVKRTIDIAFGWIVKHAGPDPQAVGRSINADLHQVLIADLSVSAPLEGGGIASIPVDPITEIARTVFPNGPVKGLVYGQIDLSFPFWTRCENSRRH